MNKISLILLLLSFSVTLPVQSQPTIATVSGLVVDGKTSEPLPYVNITVTTINKQFVTGTITDDNGAFVLENIPTGDYNVKVSYIGYADENLPLHVGRLNSYLDMGKISIAQSSTDIEGVTVTATRVEVASKMDKKSFTVDDNLSQQGGSVLQIMQNLPGVTVDREGKIFLRGSDKVTILIDGKQTAITGMGAQSGLDNIPASAIESVEIINNPSARHDASGMAGIVNIIFKKDKEYGFNGKAGLTLGVGSLTQKKESLDGIRDQYAFTPKINPSVSVNYKKSKTNIFAQADLLYHKQMMKNEFTLRSYNDGETVYQQFLENRTQPIYNIKAGVDYNPNKKNTFTFSTLFNYREYTDLGDISYDIANGIANGNRLRLWQYCIILI